MYVPEVKKLCFLTCLFFDRTNSKFFGVSCEAFCNPVRHWSHLPLLLICTVHGDFFLLKLSSLWCLMLLHFLHILFFLLRMLPQVDFFAAQILIQKNVPWSTFSPQFIKLISYAVHSPACSTSILVSVIFDAVVFLFLQNSEHLNSRDCVLHIIVFPLPCIVSDMQ